MNLKSLIPIIYIFTAPSAAVRLEKIFSFMNSPPNSNLQGVLHIGNDYSIYLRTPSSNDTYLTYELYETLNTPNPPSNQELPYKPSIIAVSQIPIEFIKEQLRTFREELSNAALDDKVVPGTQVKTVREWQIDQALRSRDNNQAEVPLRSQPLVLRTRVD